MPRARAKRPRSGTGKRIAFAQLAEAQELFSPREPTGASPVALTKRRREVDTKIAAIIKKHKLSCSAADLLDLVLKAAVENASWWFINHEHVHGFGSKPDARSLVSVLRRAHHLLGDIQIQNRLKTVAKKVPRPNSPPRPKNVATAILPDGDPSSIKQLRSDISWLLKIAQQAETLDGRDDAGKRRDDLRAAAKPIIAYWTDCEGRSGKLTNFGGMFSKCVTFVHDCLQLIDRDVTKQLIVDLDR